MLVRLVLAAVILVSLPAASSAIATDHAAAQTVGTDTPADDQPDASASRTAQYGAWTLVAVCLILAGLLLVKIEKWEARRIPGSDSTSN